MKIGVTSTRRRRQGKVARPYAILPSSRDISAVAASASEEPTLSAAPSGMPSLRPSSLMKESKRAILAASELFAETVFDASGDGLCAQRKRGRGGSHLGVVLRPAPQYTKSPRAPVLDFTGASYLMVSSVHAR